MKANGTLYQCSPWDAGVSATLAQQEGNLRHFLYKSCLLAYACGSSHSTPGKMAVPTWPPGSRRMLCYGAPVRNGVDTISQRAIYLNKYIRTESAGVIDLFFVVKRRDRRAAT